MKRSQCVLGSERYVAPIACPARSAGKPRPLSAQAVSPPLARRLQFCGEGQGGIANPRTAMNNLAIRDAVSLA